MSLEKIATVNTTIEIKSKRKTWHRKRKKVFRGGGTVYTFEDNPRMLQRIT